MVTDDPGKGSGSDSASFAGREKLARKTSVVDEPRDLLPANRPQHRIREGQSPWVGVSRKGNDAESEQRQSPIRIGVLVRTTRRSAEGRIRNRAGVAIVSE